MENPQLSYYLEQTGMTYEEYVKINKATQPQTISENRTETSPQIIESASKVIEELEAKGLEKTKEVLQKPMSQDIGKELINFMKDGATEFEKRTGKK